MKPPPPEAGPRSHDRSYDSYYDQSRLVAALADPARFGPQCTGVRHLETHISHVLLTGTHAYKIKKPVDLGFLDFTSLADRKRYCEQELRLNRRLAPGTYVDVVAITGSVDCPVVGGDGPALEYAVRMREFPQDALASRMLARGALTLDHLDALAAEVADFHGRVERAGPATQFGSPESVLRVALQNFTTIRPRLDDPQDLAMLDALHAWTVREHAARLPAFVHRREAGFVRECHGDLHLGNIAVIDDAITIFDCIEFNDELRWIDVMSELAFTVMDLADRGRSDLAHRFQNAYLERTGDYDGLAVFRFYLAYRALVRAKVACLRASQLPAGDAKAALVAEYRGYVALAQHYAQPPEPAILITHGLSGSGKTALTQALLELTGAIRIRTDVERKRLYGMSAEQRSGSAVDAGLYAPEATERTYRRALALAETVVAAGRVAIVDGAFLKHWQRDLFCSRASTLALPCAIVAFVAPEAALRARVTTRAAAGTDASEADLAVLDRQLRAQEPLAADECATTIDFDATISLDRAADPAAWHAVLAWLGTAKARQP
jgi:aminoglycoside phosphotransferase family enzyme/predicted kinase